MSQPTDTEMSDFRAAAVQAAQQGVPTIGVDLPDEDVAFERKDVGF